jgi:hypothetical protein
VPCRGGSTRLHKGKILAPAPTGFGHLTVVLSKDGKSVTLLVHRLVALAWIRNPDNLPFVLHSDDVPSNNKVGNLRWGTHQDNMDDMLRKGRGSKGETKGNVKLTDKKVLKIRKLRAQGWTHERLADKYGVTQPNISAICNRKTWTHI